MSPYPQLLKGRERIYKLIKLEMKLRKLLGVSSLGLIPNPTQMFTWELGPTLPIQNPAGRGEKRERNREKCTAQ